MLFQIESVSLSRGQKPVLDRFSALIEEGATAVVGPSGSGKSSLLRLLNRLEQIDGDRALTDAGLDPGYADRDTAKLSVGEQQRVMLARALAVEPTVLLLDEPTSALDAEATAKIERALSRLRRRGDLSLVVVTHDPQQAERLTDAAIKIEPSRPAVGLAT
jgi:putative ABC transport system ATP-binding protein